MTVRKTWRQRDSTHGPGSSRMDPKTIRLARKMRRAPTSLETEVERLLTGLRLKFGRQVAIYGYVADFYIPSAGLVVEADGPFHAGRRDVDAVRDFRLAAKGIATLRLTAEQVRLSPRACQDDIRAAVAKRVKTA